VMIRTEETLDYGVVVPLALLAPKLKRRSVVPVYPSLLPAKAHFDCGKAIQEVIVASDRRVAVIASADLSHRLTRNAPGGYSPSGKKFDEKVIQLVGSKNTSGLVNLDPALAQKAGECGWSSLVMLSGILDRMELRPEILCYEAPFGIGCLTAQYHFA
jgi:AmmeMemoRadiSam system protein B